MPETAQETTSLISQEMAEKIGTELSRRVSFPVSESDIRRWALAVYYPEPPPARFLYADAAAASSFGGIVAPEDFNPFAWLTAESSIEQEKIDYTDPDHIEHMLAVTGPRLRHQLNGGVETEYGEPIRPGDVITGARILRGYSERTGRLGPMLFTDFDETWTNQDGVLVKRIRTTQIRY